MKATRGYTEQELLLAVEYACSMQKAEDYQTAGHHLLAKLKDGEEWEDKRELLLNELCDTDNNDSKTITLEDLHEYFEENK